MPDTLQIDSDGLLKVNADGQALLSNDDGSCCCDGPCICNFADFLTLGPDVCCDSLPDSITVQISGISNFEPADQYDDVTSGIAFLDIEGLDFNQTVVATSDQECPTNYIAYLCTGTMTNNSGSGPGPVLDVDFYVAVAFSSSGYVSVSISGSGFPYGVRIFEGIDILRATICARGPHTFSRDTTDDTSLPHLEDADIIAAEGGSISIS